MPRNHNHPQHHRHCSSTTNTRRHLHSSFIDSERKLLSGAIGREISGVVPSNLFSRSIPRSLLPYAARASRDGKNLNGVVSAFSTSSDVDLQNTSEMTSNRHHSGKRDRGRDHGRSAHDDRGPRNGSRSPRLDGSSKLNRSSSTSNQSKGGSSASTNSLSAFSSPSTTASSQQQQQQQQPGSDSPRILECALRALLRMVTGTPDQKRFARGVLQEVNDALKPQGVVARLYGSFSTGLIVPSSDVDFVVVPFDSPEAAICVGSPTKCPRSDESHDDGNARARKSRRTDREYRSDEPIDSSDSRPGSDSDEEILSSPSFPRYSFFGGGGGGAGNGRNGGRRNGSGEPATLSMLRRLNVVNGMSRRERSNFFAVGLRGISDALRSTRNFHHIQHIAHAKVPIVKSVHRSSVKVDISFNTDGLRTSQYLCERMRVPGNELARGVITLLKGLLSSWHLDDPSVGGLGSFPLSLMVLWFMEVEASPKQYPPSLRDTYAFNLVGFLKYYSEVHDYKRLGINYRDKCLFSKPLDTELYIVNPVDPNSNCAKAASLYASQIVPRFRAAYFAFMDLLTENCSTRKLLQAITSQYEPMIAIRGGALAFEQLYRTEILKDSNHKKAPSESKEREGISSIVRVIQHEWDEETNLYTGDIIGE